MSYFIDEKGNVKTKNVIKTVIFLVIGILAIIMLVRSCSSIGSTERGVITTFGKPGNEVLEPGLHFKLPIGQDVIKYDISPIEYEKTFTTGNDGAISKDLQTVGVTFTLYWHYDENKILDVIRKYKTKESIYQPISSAVKSALKAEIGKYSIEEIIANQSKIASDVNTKFRTEIEYLPIIITDFKIGNYDWDESYDAMIKKTMAQKQEVERMKQEVALSEQQAQKQVKEAQAKLEAEKLNAEALEAKARGEANAQKLKADADLYQAQQLAKASEMKRAEWKHEEEMKRLEKWNGVSVSTYIPMTANGTIVSIPTK